MCIWFHFVNYGTMLFKQRRLQISRTWWSHMINGIIIGTGAIQDRLFERRLYTETTCRELNHGRSWDSTCAVQHSFCNYMTSPFFQKLKGLLVPREQLTKTYYGTVWVIALWNSSSFLMYSLIWFLNSSSALIVLCRALNYDWSQHFLCKAQ